jgi:hypothetical protein
VWQGPSSAVVVTRRARSQRRLLRTTSHHLWIEGRQRWSLGHAGEDDRARTTAVSGTTDDAARQHSMNPREGCSCAPRDERAASRQCNNVPCERRSYRGPNPWSTHDGPSAPTSAARAHPPGAPMALGVPLVRLRAVWIRELSNHRDRERWETSMAGQHQQFLGRRLRGRRSVQDHHERSRDNPESRARRKGRNRKSATSA